MSVYLFGKSEKLEKFGALELPTFKTENNIDWVINGTMQGWRNRQPQYYNFLYQTSTKHHAIVDAKKRFTYGKGWQIDTLGLGQPELIELKSFLKKIEKSQVTPRIILDRAIHGGFAVEVIYDKAGEKIYPYHLDFSYLRESKPQYDKAGKQLPIEYYYTSDWKSAKPKENKDFTIFYPFNPNEKPDGDKRYIIYYKDYRPDLTTYPFPEYMGGLPYIQADAEVGNFVYNNVKNGFTSGYIFNFYNGDLSEDQRASIETSLKASKHGSENAGDPFVAFNNQGDKGVEVTPIQANGQDERYIQLNEQIRDEIFTAHTVSPVVVGMKGENGFSNNADEIRTAVENFTEGYVKSVQEIFNEFLNGIIDFNEIKGNVYLQRLEPIKPQITESTLLAIADKKTVAKYYGIELPKEVTTTTVVQEKQFSKQDGLENIFSEFGVEDKDYEFVDQRELFATDIYDAIKQGTFLKQEFSSNLEKNILGALQENPDLKISELAELLKQPKGEINKAIKNLESNGLIESGTVTPEGEGELEDIEIVYKYTLRNDAPDLVTESRDFCKEMVRLSQTKSWTIDQIQAISNRVGYDVFTRRGGWYHNPETGKNTPYCRHVWAQRLVRRKK